MYAVGGYSGMDASDVRRHLIEDWGAEPKEIEKYEILAVGGDLGDYEESGWFLLRNKETRQYFEVSGSHCSCYGFEDQFDPKVSTSKYLLSDQFYVYGVDTDKFQTWFQERRS